MAFPVVDSARWSAFGLLVGFNDVFFMSLMFFPLRAVHLEEPPAQGIWRLPPRPRREAWATFCGGCVDRAAGLLSGLSDDGITLGPGGFLAPVASLGNWPVGPSVVHLVPAGIGLRSCCAVSCNSQMGRSALGRMSAGAYRRPALLFGLLVAVSALAYIPMALVFTAFDWAYFGPFFFQTSRVLYYFVYFLLGAGVGAGGAEKSLLAPDGKLARRWVLWTVAALVAFRIATAVTIAAFAPHSSPRLWEVLADSCFVLSCAASCFAFLALFVRFARGRVKLWDSLTTNAYGIYLFHYGFVIWLQYALLKATLPAISKGPLVLLGAVLLSWGMTAAIRRIPAVARVI
jgi:hypothetical protein